MKGTLPRLPGLLFLLFLVSVSLPLPLHGEVDAGVVCTYPAGGKTVGAPVTTKRGGICFVSEDRYLSFLNPAGELLWRRDLGFRPGSGPVEGPDGSFYVLGRNGTLKAYNPYGAPIWQGNIGGPPACQPWVDGDGTVITCTLDGLVTAWAHHGVPLWQRSIGNRLLEDRTVLSEDGIILLPLESGYLFALTASGQELWRFLSAGDLSRPFPAHEETVCGTGYGTVFLLDRNGKMLWNRSYTDKVEVLFRDQDYMYLRTGKAVVRCLSTAGEELWNRESPVGAVAAAGYGDGLLVVGERGAALFSADGKDIQTAFGDFGPGTWASGPEGFLLHGGENWRLSCLFTGFTVQREEKPLFSPGSSGSPETLEYRMATDYQYLRRTVEGPDEESIGRVLGEFEALYARTLPESIAPYAQEILSIAASGAVTRPLYAGKRLLNDFPLTRIRALKLLQRFGTLDTSRYLLSLLTMEWDTLVISRIIETLGVLGSDREGMVTEGILSAFGKVPGNDIRIASAAVEAVERIILYNGGVPSEAALLIGLSVYRGDYPRDLRVRASRIIMEAGR